MSFADFSIWEFLNYKYEGVSMRVSAHDLGCSFFLLSAMLVLLLLAALRPSDNSSELSKSIKEIKADEGMIKDLCTNILDKIRLADSRGQLPGAKNRNIRKEKKDTFSKTA